MSESQVATQNVAQKLFNDGTWNVYTTAVAQYNGSANGTGAPTYGYGTNIFGQTGQLAGFSIGGMFTAENPWGASNMNGSNMYSAPFLPANAEVNMTEAFLEYQYKNVVQADAGLISINNSPWLAPGYINNMMGPLATYQGALVNVYPGGGWLITALGFNAAMPLGETGGYTGTTLYNKPYNLAGVFNNTQLNDTLNGTVALGANYAAWDNNYNLRLWGYQFDNYGTLLYADTSLKFAPTENVNLTIAAQGGNDSSQTGNNAFNNNQLGTISSSFVGVQGGLTYKWLGVNLGYNSIWGQQGAFGNGAIVSPYSYGGATDPLYTTPYMMGLVDMGTAGSAYKVSVPLTFYDGNITITPSYSQFYTSVAAWQGTKEYDFTVNYAIPEVKGLNVFAVYALQSIPFSSVNSGSNFSTQLFLSYLY
jgi:hypothetical protein